MITVKVLMNTQKCKGKWSIKDQDENNKQVLLSIPKNRRERQSQFLTIKTANED